MDCECEPYETNCPICNGVPKVERLEELLGNIHYQLIKLERLLEMPERGYVRNTFNSLLRTVEPYKME